MILAIVGSTSLEGNKRAEWLIANILDRLQPEHVVSGGAPGIDTMAAEAARARGIEVTEHFPKTNRWHDGFMPRNILIAEDCTSLVRIVAHDSKTYGSGWTRDRAASMGKKTKEFVIRRKL